MITSDSARPDPDADPGVHVPLRLDERPLVERVRAGDSLAFERLFRRYYAALCTFAARIAGSDAIAEDVVQDVFRRIWERRESWTIDTTVTAYLYGATRNGIFDYRKHERVVARWEDAAFAAAEQADPVLDPAPDEIVYAAELAAAVESAARDLPERCQQAFLLKWTDGLTYDEIAEVMDISRKTVEMQMTRAYKRLREQLKAFLP